MRTVPYLTFAGNAREAMIFYRKCIGGKLEIRAIGQSPLANQMPVKMKKYILHSSLVKKEFAIMASDMVGENGLAKGNSVSILLNCDSEKEIKNIYKKLAQGGKQTHPIETTFFGSLLGDLVDKYGNTWLLHFKKTNHKLTQPRRRAAVANIKKQKHENKKDHFLDNYEYHIPF
jgi:PhnB protein